MKEKKTLYRELDEISDHDESALDALKPRLLLAAGIVIFFATIIIARLWYLQIVNFEEFHDRAYNNRVRMRKIAAPRGHVLDRNGTELVTNRPSFNVLLIREDSRNDEAFIKNLAEVLEVDVLELWNRIREASNIPLHIPIRLKEDIKWETLAYLENHNQEFSGIRIEVTPRRVYHFGDLAAHIIGYLGAISKEELEKVAEDEYDGGDQIGKMGIEKLREFDLRGEKGLSFSEVNARGFEQQMLKNVDPLPGRELHLTIDVRLQQKAESMMNEHGHSGAVVAMEVNSGRLLTMASAPSIQLDDFIGGISHSKWKALIENEKKPLLNKAVQGAYPPGSTYKMITALAGLETGVVDESTVFYCPGYYAFGNRVYRCWKRVGHGAVNLRRAIGESCDVFFYQVGQQVGVDYLAKVAKRFGLGDLTGVSIEHEKKGIVPTTQWKRRRFNERWHEGETLSVAIGQGYNLTTPLQMAVMTSMIANNGIQYLPQLVERVVDADGNILESFEPEVLNEAIVSDRQLKLIKEGMFDVIQGDRGTARIARIDGINIAGKTGTAQVVKISQYKGLKEDEIPYKYRDHAWFTCYAPAEKPEIAVTVLVEHGLHGSSAAAPIAKGVLKTYFADRLGKEQ